MKKARLKSLQVFATVSALSAVALVATVLLTVWYVKHLEGEVTSKFEGQKWKFPSKIYSDTYLLYPGISVGANELQEKLRRLGYRLGQVIKTKGEYRVTKGGGAMDVYLHDFDYPAVRFEGFPVRLHFQSGNIARMENLTSGEELFSLELEPELIAGLYDRIWEERRVVRLPEVPPLLVKAILAIEDERFFRHRGVDPVAILRAAWVNLTSRGIVQGGSTLTQQLMKNFFLGDERTLRRKAKEALMALIAEHKYSKEEILENYLNEIYLGQRGAQGIFGVWEAARFYFGKNLRDLTIGEMALTAGLIRAPNRYSPYRSIEVATQRRNVVLAKMRDLGLISRSQYEKSLQDGIQPRELIKVANDAPSFVDFLRKELAENYSNEVLTADGLRIFTSLDLHLQRLAETSLARGLKRLEEAYPFLRKRSAEDRLDGAIVVIKPQTGEIKAMAGGRDYQISQFNRVVQAKRQPGSVFKPFVYLAALMFGSEDGNKRFTPVSLVEDAPFTWSYEGQEWQPNNYKGEYFGIVTFRTALEKSLNAATIRIARETGVRNVREVAYRLGIQSPLPVLPSLALGGVEVTPLEVAAAFSTLANNGVRTQLLSVKHVLGQQQNVLERRDIRVRKVVSPQLAFMMNHLLKGVVDRGTAASARAQGFNRPAAGKTGTTNDTKDAWFVGYTPDLLAVVWVGFDNQSKLGLSGSQAALPIWTDFMKGATEGTPVTDFVAPAGIQLLDIDPLSGQRATANCPQVIHEAFLEGEEPNAVCQLHPAGIGSEWKFPLSATPGFQG